ncbi:unnamed protein product [Closterium sp. Naga37s-1]|nr:unnamed protein product [Closterium sp. Naga37s-1]
MSDNLTSSTTAPSRSPPSAPPDALPSSLPLLPSPPPSHILLPPPRSLTLPSPSPPHEAGRALMALRDQLTFLAFANPSRSPKAIRSPSPPYSPIPSHLVSPPRFPLSLNFLPPSFRAGQALGKLGDFEGPGDVCEPQPQLQRVPFSFPASLPFPLNFPHPRRFRASAGGVKRPDHVWQALVALRDQMTFVNPSRSPQAFWKSADNCEALYGVVKTSSLVRSFAGLTHFPSSSLLTSSAFRLLPCRLHLVAPWWEWSRGSPCMYFCSIASSAPLHLPSSPLRSTLVGVVRPLPTATERAIGSGGAAPTRHWESRLTCTTFHRSPPRSFTSQHASGSGGAASSRHWQPSFTRLPVSFLLATPFSRSAS